MRLYFGMTIAIAAFICLGATGCGGKTEGPSPGAVVDRGHREAEHEGGDHSGWWCKEHGVPEEECALCDTTLVADFQAKGDWCDEHHRPESQCFVCDPGRFASFAARYEAKFGQQPPQPTD